MFSENKLVEWIHIRAQDDVPSLAALAATGSNISDVCVRVEMVLIEMLVINIP